VEIVNESFGPSSARAVRGLIAIAGLKRIEYMDDYALDCVLDSIDFLKIHATEDAVARAGIALWSRTPEKLATFLTDPKRRDFAEGILRTLSINQVIEGIQKKPNTALILLDQRPDLLTSVSFWAIDDIPKERAIEALSLTSVPAGPVIEAMIRAHRRDLAPLVGRSYGGLELLRAVTIYLEGKYPWDDVDIAWVDEAVLDRNAVAKFLSERHKMSESVLTAIARSTQPDSIPNEIGEDPWLSTLRASHSGVLHSEERQYLYSYLLARALGDHSNSRAELIAATLNEVYGAASESRLSSEAWSLLDSKLPWSYWSSSWDRCKRLRVGVVNAFVEKKLSPLIFGTLTQDEQFFSELAETAAKTWFGREFLKRVKDELEMSNLALNHREAIRQIL
jgi:hypothetical protein